MKSTVNKKARAEVQEKTQNGTNGLTSLTIVPKTVVTMKPINPLTVIVNVEPLLLTFGVNISPIKTLGIIARPEKKLLVQTLRAAKEYVDRCGQTRSKALQDDASDRTKWKKRTRKADPTIRWE
ncbi:unnamed protein product [Danaus chrysippus]|uniref:(African queen) hypothetical protein n=1 Tax=Danaus chrysippus TaxID=151541 RepID=A0A8J2VTJ4_9NEOP|nr:unnamed protein product [Danaus chrysippus]